LGNSGNPRAAALASLYTHAAALAAVGDLAGARALQSTITKLLGEEGGAGGGRVVDNTPRRGER
jgi:hypothetical protein